MDRYSALQIYTVLAVIIASWLIAFLMADSDG